ncbi:unnamed protein product [Rotaria socialis]|uniref:ABC transmembrane type-1 domain-containing protein n=1 Tax=Rotaria socialis TaxID=392032 RepID=A0A818FP44_9BILA|nr:unnamed protein product [Rotaria socialis]
MVRLSMGSLGAQSSGKIINMMTNDVQTVDHLGLDAHFLWIGTLETIVVLVILWSHVGFTILLAMIYTLMVISVQILCGKVMQIIWTKRVQQTDLRIKLMNEIVKSIHLVKMYVWERPFQLKVERVRRKETFYVILKSLMNTVKIVNGYSFSLIFFLIVFGLLWYRRAPFNTDFFTIAFVLISYLRHTYLHGFATSCVNISQYWVAVQRIQEFLNAGEFNQQKMIVIENEFNSENKLTVDIQNLSSTWESSSFQLRNVTFSARTGELIIVIGSIASGKSSLLMTLLGEMKMIGGAVKLNRNARFCYVPQESWIFSDSIKENILFGMEFNEKKFNESIYAAGFDTGNQLASGTYSQLHQMCPEFKQWTQTNTNNPRLDSSSASDTASQLNSSPTPEFVTQFSLFAGVPTSPETEKLLVPTTEKSVQKQTEEFKRIGSVSGSVYLRYIQASLWGVLGIAIIFTLFMGTSVLTLFTNWWLGRWSNAERIRYASKSTNANCTIENHSPILNMTMNAWFKKRDNYFYTLLG